jgi:DNA-binding transcriptional ArsR family regulator
VIAGGGEFGIRRRRVLPAGIRALVVVGQQGLTPGTIAEALQMPPATLSFHLKELTNAGLVTQERSGRSLGLGKAPRAAGEMSSHDAAGEVCPSWQFGMGERLAAGNAAVALLACRRGPRRCWYFWKGS